MRLRRARETILSLFEAISQRDYERAQHNLRYVEAIYGSARTEYIRGYLNALQGMVESLKRVSTKPLLNEILAAREPESYLLLRREVAKQSKLGVRDPVDRGYFEAWVDLLTFLIERKVS